VKGRARRAAVSALAVALAAAAPPAARADVCGSPREAAAGGPLAAGTDAADFGAIPETCAGTDAGLRLRTTLLVASAMPDYYGALASSATVRLRQRVGGRASRTTLTVAADLLTFRYVANAVVASDGFGFGPPTLGVQREVGEGTFTAVSVYGRALLPLDTARQSGVRMGLELGATARRVLGARGRGGLQGGLALVGPLVIVGGESHGALQPVGLVEGWFAPGPRFALFLGAEARFEATPDPTFLTLAPRLAARWALRHGLGLAALVETPVAGADRTDLVAGLYLGYVGSTAGD
jgi:hypothetical protein